MAIFLLVKGSPLQAARTALKQGIALVFDGRTSMGETRAYAEERDAALVRRWFIAHDDLGPAPIGTLLWYREGVAMPATLTS